MSHFHFSSDVYESGFRLVIESVQVPQLFLPAQQKMAPAPHDGKGEKGGKCGKDNKGGRGDGKGKKGGKGGKDNKGGNGGGEGGGDKGGPGGAAGVGAAEVVSAAPDAAGAGAATPGAAGAGAATGVGQVLLPIMGIPVAGEGLVAEILAGAGAAAPDADVAGAGEAAPVANAAGDGGARKTQRT